MVRREPPFRIGSYAGIVADVAHSQWLWATIVILAMLLVVMPWRPGMPAQNLDAAWVLTLVHAFDARLQWGPDLTFVYGPLGFVQLGIYSPHSYAWTMSISAFVLTLLGLLYFRLLRRVPFVLGAATIAIILSAGSVWREAIYGSAAIVVGLTLCEPEAGELEYLALALLCGPISMMKFSYFISISAVYLIATAYRALRWRQYPLPMALWMIAALAAYLISGQHLSSLPEFLRSSFDMSAGYGEAMQTFGSHGDVYRFALMAGALVVILALNEYQRDGAWALFPIAIIAMVVLVIAKDGFVRHDDGHQRVAVPLLLTTVALCCAWTARRWVNNAAVALLAVTFAIFETTMPGNLLADARGNATAIHQMLKGSANLTAQYQYHLASIRTAWPLPVVSGDADIYSFGQSALIASGNRVRMRPQFQSLTAYTRYLIERNVDFLRSPAAPSTIFFDVQPIDHRLVAFEDGASWPELLTRYDITDDTHQFLRLDRRSTPRTYTMAPLLQRTIRLGEELQIYKPGDSLIWARIDLRKTLLGKLLTMASKAPLLMLDVTMRDGTMREFRILPAAAAEGFLLSPIVTSRIDFAALGLPELRSYLAKWQVVSIRVDPRPFARLSYRDEVPITLEQLELRGASPTLPSSLSAAVRDFESTRRY